MTKNRIVTPPMTYWKCPDCGKELHFHNSDSDDIKIQAIYDHECSTPPLIEDKR